MGGSHLQSQVDCIIMVSCLHVYLLMPLVINMIDQLNRDVIFTDS